LPYPREGKLRYENCRGEKNRGGEKTRKLIITQGWLEDFYANVVKSKYKGSLKNRKIRNKRNVKRKR